MLREEFEDTKGVKLSVLSMEEIIDTVGIYLILSSPTKKQS
jgi:hypothetical protein